jgi:hypothetical protein
MAKKQSKMESGAFKIGKSAFKKGMKRIPAFDPELIKMIPGKAVGESSPYFLEWLKGYDTEMLASKKSTDFEILEVIVTDYNKFGRSKSVAEYVEQFNTKPARIRRIFKESVKYQPRA